LILFLNNHKVENDYDINSKIISIYPEKKIYLEIPNNMDVNNILYYQNKYIIPCSKIVDNNSIKFTYILDEKLNIYNKIDNFDLNYACNDNILIVNKKYYDFKNKIEIYDAENFIFWLDDKAIEYFNKEKKLIFKKFIETIIKNNIQCECSICFNNIMNRVTLI